MIKHSEEGKIPIYGDSAIKTLIAIGSIGEGKSSLCNSLAGKEYDDIEFPIDGTSTTSRKKLKWRGDGQNVWLIDTPGLFAQSESEENKSLDSMITELKKNSEVHVFAIVLNGSKPRFDQSRKQMLRKFKQMFGDSFLDKNAVFVITNWHYDESSCAKRLRIGQNEASKTSDINKTLRDNFGVRNPKVPVIFLDVQHQKEESEEKRQFQKGLDELQQCLNTFQSYPSSSFRSPLSF